MSSNHTENMASYTLRILRTTGSSCLDVTTFINFRSGLSRETEYLLGAPKGFFLKWHELGYPGIDAEVYGLLKSWRLRGCIKGDAVKRLDPTKGPLTDIELTAFNEAAIRLFERDEIALSELGIALLVSNSGRRPIQIAHMKTIDLDGTARNLKGERVPIVRIPRAKQRAERFRSSFRAFSITEELLTILNAQRQAAIRSVEACLRQSLDESERIALPLFPDMAAFSKLQQSDLSLATALESDRLHIRAAWITDVLRKIARIADCRSERTGEILNSKGRSEASASVRRQCGPYQTNVYCSIPV